MKKHIALIATIVVLLSIMSIFSFSSKEHAENISVLNSLKEKYTIFAIPKPSSTIFFANERVPLENPDIWERYDKELLKNTYWQSKNRPKPEDYGYFFIRVFPTVFDHKNTSKKFHPPTYWN